MIYYIFIMIYQHLPSSICLDTFETQKFIIFPPFSTQKNLEKNSLHSAQTLGQVTSGEKNVLQWGDKIQFNFFHNYFIYVLFQDTKEGTPIMRVSATDIDEGDNQRITYEFQASQYQQDIEYFR